MDLESRYINEDTDGIPKEVLEGARKVGEGRKAFRRMLETYVPQVGYSSTPKPRILNLGCGECYEAHVLSGYFGNQPDGFSSEDVLVVGIDVDEEAIERARTEYQTRDAKKLYIWTKQPAENYKFIHEDARKLRELVDGKFDVIVARHPNVAEIPDAWHDIFRESNEVIRPNGILLATSFSDIEHKILEEQIRRAAYKIALSSSNQHSIPTDYKEVSIDRNILIAKK